MHLLAIQLEHVLDMPQILLPIRSIASSQRQISILKFVHTRLGPGAVLLKTLFETHVAVSGVAQSLGRGLFVPRVAVARVVLRLLRGARRVVRTEVEIQRVFDGCSVVFARRAFRFSARAVGGQLACLDCVQLGVGVLVSAVVFLGGQAGV